MRAGAQPYVALEYLVSYEHMGMANVSCGAPGRRATQAPRSGVAAGRGGNGAASSHPEGCTCLTSTLNAHRPAQHTSEPLTHVLHVSAAAECVVRVTVLGSSTSREHRFKLIGLRVGELVTSDAARLRETPEAMNSLEEQGRMPGGGAGGGSMGGAEPEAGEARGSRSATETLCARWS